MPATNFHWSREWLWMTGCQIVQVIFHYFTADKLQAIKNRLYLRLERKELLVPQVKRFQIPVAEIL